jgi:hypothetical protein
MPLRWAKFLILLKMKSLLTNIVLAILAVTIYIFFTYTNAKEADYPGITYAVMLLFGNMYSIITTIVIILYAKDNGRIWKSFWFFTSLLLNIIGSCVVVYWLIFRIEGISILLLIIYCFLPILVIWQVKYFSNSYRNFILLK